MSALIGVSAIPGSTPAGITLNVPAGVLPLSRGAFPPMRPVSAYHRNSPINSYLAWPLSPFWHEKSTISKPCFFRKDLPDFFGA